MRKSGILMRTGHIVGAMKLFKFQAPSSSHFWGVLGSFEYDQMRILFNRICHEKIYLKIQKVQIFNIFLLKFGSKFFLKILIYAM